MYVNGLINHDFGKVHDCVCRKQTNEELKKAWLMKFCNFPRIAQQLSFETLNVTPLVEEAYYAALDVIGRKTIFLTLVGKTDTGKSHIAISVCKEFLRFNIPAKFEYCPLLLDRLRATYEEDAEYSFAKLFDMYSKVPLLVLDDLYREHPTKWGVEKLGTLINERYSEMRMTIITTNKPLSIMDEAIRSRLQREEWCKVVVIGQPLEENIP